MPEADLILINANIVTMDPGHPHGKALAVQNGRVLAVSETENRKQFCLSQAPCSFKIKYPVS